MIADIIVKDDYTITFALKTTQRQFSPDPWRGRAPSSIRARPSTRSRAKPIGTGPYKVAEWVRGDRIVLAEERRLIT